MCTLSLLPSARGEVAPDKLLLTRIQVLLTPGTASQVPVALAPKQFSRSIVHVVAALHYISVIRQSEGWKEICFNA